MTRLLTWMRARPRTSLTAAAALILLTIGATFWRRAMSVDPALTALVSKGTLSARITASGVLRPLESLTYRSPLGGREAEIVFLAPEGTRVNEGDLLVRLDTTELQRELEHGIQEVRQAQVDLQVADIDRQESQASLDSLSVGEGAISVDEAKAKLQAAQKRAARLKEEYQTLKTLMDKGFITREELRKTADELEQADEELALAKRRSDLFIERTHPQDKKRAELQLAQKDAQRENVRARLEDAQARAKLLKVQLEDCSIYAQRPGLVVFEDFLGASPRRRIRAGDRVTGSQGLVTIPGVNRMLVDASVTEADVHRLHPGLPAEIRLEAFPDLRLTGKVSRIGTLARASAERQTEDKRFDLIVDLDPTDVELRPEMTARADILLGERAGVLLVPINAVFERQGVLICLVVHALGVESRPVELGESSDVAVEVLSGLKEGERVALVDVSSPAAPAQAPTSRQGAGLRSGSTLAPR
jgi:HlyD family secretion protein